MDDLHLTFWKHVDVQDSEDVCWLWTGDQWYCPKQKQNTSSFTWKKKRWNARKFAYMLGNGLDIKFLPMLPHIKNTCRNTLCCNPSHLTK